MKILIGADIVPTFSNQYFFENFQMEKIVDENLINMLSEADYRIFNLEVPLAEKSTPIEKYGPKLRSTTKSVLGLKQLNIDFLTLANNHILDQGYDGLQSTIQTLKSSEISFAGVGDTLNEASKPYIAEIDGKKIGIYCCAEHEFSIVNEKQAGANPFDPLESLDHISELKARCDYVIVLHHGGKEHYRYPSPMLQKVCRKMVEKGADLVVTQHSHCIGCMEQYRDSTIIYGQGNFLFDESDIECWRTSLLVCIDECFEISFIPLKKADNGVRLANDNEAREILSQFKSRSEEIKSPEALKKRYTEFANEMYVRYLATIAGKEGFLFKSLNKLSGGRLRRFKISRRYKGKSLLALRNYIECEAHRELILQITDN